MPFIDCGVELLSENPSEDGNEGDESTRAAGIIRFILDRQQRTADAIVPGFSRAVAMRLEKALADGSVIECLGNQRDIFCRIETTMPEAIFAIEATAVRAFEEIAGEGRVALARRGELLADPERWEQKLCGALLDDAWSVVSLESRRVPFCSLAYSYRGRRTESWKRSVPDRREQNLDCRESPTVDMYNGVYAGWRILGVLETRKEKSLLRERRDHEATAVLSCLACNSSVAGPFKGIPVFPADDLGATGGQWALTGRYGIEGHTLVGLTPEGLGRLWYIEGIRREALIPHPWLVQELKLQICENQPWCLRDSIGVGLAPRIWRTSSSGSGEIYVPEYWGMDWVLRPDLFRRLEETLGTKLRWAIMLMSSGRSLADDTGEGGEDS